MAPPLEYVALFDGCCKFCRRGARLLQILDRRDRIDLIDLNNADRVSVLPQKFDRAALQRDFHAVRSDGQIFRGYEAYCELVTVLPALRIVGPIMRWQPVAALGNRIYRHIADHRCTSATCRV